MEANGADAWRIGHWSSGHEAAIATRTSGSRSRRAIDSWLSLIASCATSTAEDAVQQTLVAMWSELPRLRDPDRFEVWTYRLVVRFSLAEARRQRRLGVVVKPISADVPEPHDELDGVSARDQLERAFRNISPDHRAVLVLHHYLGLSHAEMAKAMGVPAGTISSRLHRATEQMRAALDADSRVTAGPRALT